MKYAILASLSILIFKMTLMIVAMHVEYLKPIYEGIKKSSVTLLNDVVITLNYGGILLYVVFVLPTAIRGGYDLCTILVSIDEDLQAKRTIFSALLHVKNIWTEVNRQSINPKVATSTVAVYTSTIQPYVLTIIKYRKAIFIGNVVSILIMITIQIFIKLRSIGDSIDQSLRELKAKIDTSTDSMLKSISEAKDDIQKDLKNLTKEVLKTRKDILDIKLKLNEKHIQDGKGSPFDLVGAIGSIFTTVPGATHTVNSTITELQGNSMISAAAGHAHLGILLGHSVALDAAGFCGVATTCTLVGLAIMGLWGYQQKVIAAEKATEELRKEKDREEAAINEQLEELK